MMGYVICLNIVLVEYVFEYYMSMGYIVEQVVEMYGVFREDQDVFVVWSYQNVVKVFKEGKFNDEIVLVEVLLIEIGDDYKFWKK